jgi:hypothetical protein
MVVGSILAASALFAGLIIFGAVACSTSDIRSGLAGPVPSSPEALLTELKEDKDRIDAITDGMAERVRSFNESRDPGERILQLSEIFYDDISGEERDVLNAMLASEQDVSYKALLRSLVRDRDTIRGLQNKVLRLEQSLPDRFVVARKGDSQHELAIAYLTEEAGLDRPRSERILSRIDMSDELVPGNKVWFFFDGDRDVFRTYVTQGEAGQMPIALRRALKRKLVSERDAAEARASGLTMELQLARMQQEAEVATLSEEIDDLKDRRAELESEVESLEQEQEYLETQVTGLTAALVSSENSLFFHAAAEKELRDRGILTRVLKRFQDVKNVEYDRALDLSRATRITLDAADLGLEKIDRVRLFPSIYHAERDYVVERSEDGTAATVVILDPGLFRGKEVVLSVKG